MRTEQQIVDDANKLARELYGLMGYTVPEGYRFDRAHHPHEQSCWRMACVAYEMIEGTDVEDALGQLE